MSETITYYFALTSTWAYVGHDNFVELARRHGAGIDYRPLPLHDLFEATGGLPLSERKRWRQDYRFLELQRWRDKLGKTFNLRPVHWPLPNDLADRVVLAILDKGDDPHPAISRFYSGTWERDENLNDPDVVVRLADEVGFDGRELTRIADLPHIRERYRNNLDAAVADGVFGSPAFILNGELFWGQDRLPFLDEALISGRPPYKVAGNV